MSQVISVPPMFLRYPVERTTRLSLQPLSGIPTMLLVVRTACGECFHLKEIPDRELKGDERVENSADRMASCWTVGRLKDRVAAETGIATPHQRLIFMGELLFDDDRPCCTIRFSFQQRTLHLAWKKGASLKFRKRSLLDEWVASSACFGQTQITIYVRNMGDRNDSFRVKPETPVRELRQEVCWHNGMPLAQTGLVFGGNSMMDEYTLSDYAIQDHDVLEMVFQSRPGIRISQRAPGGVEKRRIVRYVAPILKSESASGLAPLVIRRFLGSSSSSSSSSSNHHHFRGGGCSYVFTLLRNKAELVEGYIRRSPEEKIASAMKQGANAQCGQRTPSPRHGTVIAQGDEKKACQVCWNVSRSGQCSVCGSGFQDSNDARKSAPRTSIPTNQQYIDHMIAEQLWQEDLDALDAQAVQNWEWT